MDPGGSGIDNTGGHVFFEGLSVTPMEAGLLTAFEFTCTGRLAGKGMEAIGAVFTFYG